MQATIEVQVLITVEAPVEAHDSLSDIKNSARQTAQAAVNRACLTINEADDNTGATKVTLRSGVVAVKSLRDIE